MQEALPLLKYKIHKRFVLLAISRKSYRTCNQPRNNGTKFIFLVLKTRRQLTYIMNFLLYTFTIKWDKSLFYKTFENIFLKTCYYNLPK